MEAFAPENERENERENSERRQEMASKVLAVELGITDGPTVLRVARALPGVAATRAPTDRDREELAGFLRTQLKLS